MTSRERVKKAIHFQNPDHIPHHLPDGKENDILWLWLKRPPDIQPWEEINGRQRRIDPWGAIWETMGGGSFGEVTEWPIKDITRQAECVFPDLNNPRYLVDVKAAIQANAASDNPKYCLAVMPFSSIHEKTHGLIGLENMFVAYYEHPDDLKALIGRLAEKQRESIRILGEYGCDGVMGYDDWGVQDGLMISRAMIEEFFMPHYRGNWGVAHDLDMDVWLHSCGYIVEVLPQFIAAGLNAIQMDQQENMGLDTLNRHFGGKLAFWCPVDIQNTMVNGAIEDIRDYVRQMVETIGSHNGGLISMAYSTPEAVGHTPEKIAAMCAAFREFGKYRK